MKSKRIYIILINSLLYSGIGFSQTICIPFHLDKSKNIILDYAIKGEKVKLFFDTGWQGNIIDIRFSDKLNLVPYKQNKRITRSTVGGRQFNLILPDNGSFVKADTLFNDSWALTDMKMTGKSLHLDNDVKGIVGIDFNEYKYVVELDFKNNRLCFWDSIPQNYLKDGNAYKVILVRSDFGNETKTSKYFAKYPNMKGSLTITDTVQLHPIFKFDTGNTAAYLCVQVYDSLMFKRMLDYKKRISQQYGNNYPTTHVQLPELGIDSLYVNLAVFQGDNDDPGFMKANKVRGLLGMNFFLQYEKVLFDCKKKIGYFVKKK